MEQDREITPGSIWKHLLNSIRYNSCLIWKN
jgi:hypothetical protein